MKGRSAWRAAGLAVTLACSPAPAPSNPLPPNSFAFGVYGDGPYYFREQRAFQRVLRDVESSDVQFLIHVGDIFWFPCTDRAYLRRLRHLDGVDRAVVYTPGDNEWADCHTARAGRFDPLERLASLRRIFFRNPDRSLGMRPIQLESQARKLAFRDFPENARWKRGGFIFATIHLVGSNNALEEFPGRSAAHTEASQRRTAAAMAWLRETFEMARADSAKGIVLAMHANIGLSAAEPRGGFEPFVRQLEESVKSFPGRVLLIHGDSHTYRVDTPLRSSFGGVYPDFTRLETFGSPQIGWVRVVIDTLAERVVEYEPRLMQRR